MLDVSYRQWGIGPRWSIMTAMWDRSDMENRVDIDSIRENLRRIMLQKDVKPTTLSLRVGPSKTLVADLLTKTDDVKLGTLNRLATALDVDVGELLAQPWVPIAGYIGAGGQVCFEEFAEQSGDETMMVPRAPGISGPLIALLVRGDSMLPKYRDGDIIYIQRQHDGVLAEYIGDDCAVKLASGETYVKQLAFGSEPGRYSLVSLNAEQMTDVEIEWATPVVFIMPRRARERITQ
jgi:phage repressor protein C with HTH and peptisase S24 domain